MFAMGSRVDNYVENDCKHRFFGELFNFQDANINLLIKHMYSQRSALTIYGHQDFRVRPPCWRYTREGRVHIS